MSAPGRHSLSWTIALTVLGAVGLSVCPLPDALRPWPSLLQRPGETLVAIVVPAAATRPQPEQPPEPELPDVPDLPDGPEVTEPPVLVEHPTQVAPEPLSGPSAPPVRLSPEEKRRGRRLEVLAARVGARHVEIEEGCLRGADDHCERRALSPFFEALEGLHRGARTTPVRVLALGTSLIVSDHITDVLRARLQSRHGDGGRGLLLVDRPVRGAGRTVRTGTATDGWEILLATDEPPARTLGLSGIGYVAPAGSRESSTFETSGATSAELFFLAQPGGGDLELLGDAGPLGRWSTAGAGTAGFATVELPAGTRRVTVRARGGPVRLDGVSLEGAPGVVFDTFGLPGATPTVLLREDEELFRAQLSRRAPKLVVLVLGGNDAFDLSLHRYPVEKAREQFDAFLARVRDAAPGAACLLAAPPDAGLWRMDQSIAVRKETEQVSAYMRELAAEHGCAFYDLQQAMGGSGAIERWWAEGLMNRDLVHPSALGADLLGYLVDEALDRARLRRTERQALTARSPRVPPRALLLGQVRPSSVAPTVRGQLAEPAPTEAPASAPPAPASTAAPAPAARAASAQSAEPGTLALPTTSPEPSPSEPEPASGDAGVAPGVGLVAPAPLEGSSWPPFALAELTSLEGGGGLTPLQSSAVEWPEWWTPHQSPQDASVWPGQLENLEALVPFFERLDALESSGQGRIAVVQLGASHTAAHFFTDAARERLAMRFGAAGRGYVAAGRPSERLSSGGVWRELRGAWRVEDALKNKAPGREWGLTGTRAVGPAGASLVVGFDERHGTADDVARVQVSWLDAPDAGAIEVAIDGRVVARPAPAGADSGPRVRVLQLSAPGSRHAVTVTSLGPAPVAVFGVSHELMRPGIVYDALGLPGSTVMTLASYAQEALVEQLRAREVDLFVLFYGTNEASLPPDQVNAGLRPAYQTVFNTLRAAAPTASCLVLAPTDRMSRKRGTPWRPAASEDLVTAELRALARENGCAFYATREAMGGPGSIHRWWRAMPSLAHRDHVHLTPLGYQQLAGGYMRDLLDAWESWRAAR